MAHGGCCKHCFLGTPQPGFRLALVVQAGVIEVLNDVPEDGALLAGYADYMRSIRDIYPRGRPPTPY